MTASFTFESVNDGAPSMGAPLASTTVIGGAGGFSGGTLLRATPAPDDGPAHVENREQIERLLLQLPPAESELIRLFHLEGRSYGEISRMTGMSLGSIGPMLARARQKLRERDE